MAMTLSRFSLACIAVVMIRVSTAQTCSNYTFSATRVFSSCKDLPVLQAHLHWNYIPTTKTVEIAYRAPHSSTGWVAWGINPERAAMRGSQAIVAFKNSDGTMNVFTTPINSYSPSMKPGPVSFRVSNLSAEYSNGEMTIFARVGPLQSVTGVNHVWQAGPVTNGSPASHVVSGPNIRSVGNIDFA